MNTIKTYFLMGLLLLVPLFIFYQVLFIVASVVSPFTQNNLLFNFILGLIVITLLGWGMVHIFKRRIRKHLKRIAEGTGFFPTIASLFLEFDALSNKTQKAFRHPVLYKVDDGIYKLGYITNKDSAFLHHQENTTIKTNTDTEATPAPDAMWIYAPYPINFFGDMVLVERRKIRILHKDEMQNLPLFIISAGILQK